MGILIATIGPSGVGKTSLVRALAQAHPFATALEQHEERLFQVLFEQDPRYGLINQVDFFLLRASQEHQLRASSRTGLIDGGLDLDYHGFTRLFHKRGLLDDQEHDLCRQLYAALRTLLPLPELFLRLRTGQDTVSSRLSTRDRINIASAEDYPLLEAFLDEWLAEVDPVRILEVNVTKHDPHYAHIVPQVLAEIEERFGKF
jgi:deoxyadenosine/deoxycytidine kinase